MHVVIWTIGEDQFATPTRNVVEVTSVVDARDLPHSEPWVCGLINYRGRPIPLVDVSQLLGRGPANRQLYARILVVKRGDTAETEWLGLLVESVLSAEALDFDAAESVTDSSIQSPLAFLGPISLFDRGAIQLTDATEIKTTLTKAESA